MIWSNASIEINRTGRKIIAILLCLLKKLQILFRFKVKKKFALSDLVFKIYSFDKINFRLT